jgi:hypothetical protein
MSKQFLIFLGVGLAVVALGLAGTFWMTRGSHLTLTGAILKVRTMPADEKSSVAVIDFRVTNDSDVPFVTEDATLTVTGPDGKEFEGETVARSDMDRIFEDYKLIGPKFNPILIIRDRIAGGQTMDRMVAARFEAPESTVQNRKNLVLHLHDIDGATFDIAEKQ